MHDAPTWGATSDAVHGNGGFIWAKLGDALCGGCGVLGGRLERGRGVGYMPCMHVVGVWLQLWLLPGLRESCADVDGKFTTTRRYACVPGGGEAAAARAAATMRCLRLPVLELSVLEGRGHSEQPQLRPS